MNRSTTSNLKLLAVSLFVAAGCTAVGSDTAAPERSVDVQNDSDSGVAFELPEREGERVATSESVPHVQLGVGPVAEIDAELRRRAFLFPSVSSQPSGISLPGAVQLAFDDDLELARPDVIALSQEFAHIHPDGSLHVWLPLDVAVEVDEQRWGELHPWVGRESFWGGVVMIYTPQTEAELDITMRILAEGYNFVVGADVDAEDLN